jgi:hypothetical protein
MSGENSRLNGFRLKFFAAQIQILKKLFDHNSQFLGSIDGQSRDFFDTVTFQIRNFHPDGVFSRLDFEEFRAFTHQKNAVARNAKIFGKRSSFAQNL